MRYGSSDAACTMIALSNASPSMPSKVWHYCDAGHATLHRQQLSTQDDDFFEAEGAQRGVSSPVQSSSICQTQNPGHILHSTQACPKLLRGALTISMKEAVPTEFEGRAAKLIFCASRAVLSILSDLS